MNHKVSFLFIALLSQEFLMSCNNDNSTEHTSPLQKDSSTSLSIVSNKVDEIIDTISVSSSSQIIGTWEDLGKELLTVDITKNTITYREHNESHNFKLKSDSIYIYYPDLALLGRPYLIKDTFVISMATGVNKYVRLKK